MPAGPLRRALAAALPDRPFTVAFWDGGVLPATAPDGPTFTLRSPAAVAHALRAPGQLGVGRAYVSGELAVDDLDRVMRLLDGWKPPPLGVADRARLAAAAVAAAGPRFPARPTA